MKTILFAVLALVLGCLASNYQRTEYVITVDDTLALEQLGPQAADTQYHDGIRPLHIACDIGTIASIRTLVRKGVTVTVFNARDRTPLDICVEKQRLDCVAELLRAGARPDSLMGSYNSGTTLFKAINTRNLAIVELLLKAGSSLRISNYDGETPFLVAACSANPAILKLLLKNGADLRQIDEDDIDALHNAKSCKNKENEAFLKPLFKEVKK